MARLFARHPAALSNTLRVLEAGSGFSSAELQHEALVRSSSPAGKNVDHANLQKMQHFSSSCCCGAGTMAERK
jgi:hypothetical protein